MQLIDGGYMLKDITFGQSKGKVQISWSWNEGENIEGVVIKFKKREFIGEGSRFLPEMILRYQGQGTAMAEKELGSMWGLYDFEFVPVRKDGRETEVIEVKDILLGENKHFFWKKCIKKKNTKIIFETEGERIPKDIVDMLCQMKGKKFQYRISYPIDENTELIFPDIGQLEQITFEAREPYNRAYIFQEKR